MYLLHIKKKSFPLTDNGKESSRASCPPAFILHTERKSTAVESDGEKVCDGISSFKNLVKLLNCTKQSQDKGLCSGWSWAGGAGLCPTAGFEGLSVYLTYLGCFIEALSPQCWRIRGGMLAAGFLPVLEEKRVDAGGVRVGAGTEL